MEKRNNKMIDRISNNIQNLLNLSYLKTFQASPDNKRLLKISSDKIHKSIDNLMDNVSSINGVSNISLLYSRLGDLHNDKEIVGEIDKLFGENGTANIDSMMSLYMENKHIKDYEAEIDIVCKYMPLLEDSLEFKQELVLSADDLRKDFISFKNKTGNLEGLIANIESVKDTYQLQDKIKDIYYQTSKYGEEFYFVSPYSKLLKNELGRKGSNITTIKESTLKEEKISLEGTGISEFNITIDHNIPDSIIREAKQTNIKFDSIFNDKNDNDLVPDNTIDGLVTNNKNTNDVNVNGCYVKRLDRGKVLPIYIEDTCLGYFYVDVEEDSTMDHFMQNMNDPTIAMKKNRIELNNSADNNMRDNVLKSIANKVTSLVDNKFINNNESLKREIYLLMKYSHEHNNGMININLKFLSPDEVFHFYFKKDPKTNRGISDLHRAIIPAKLYCSIYIANAFAILTRGQDKRVYYVKQSVDTNISQLMLNTINQIKKSNFGLRDLNNLETILNITGRFNDYIIPTNSSGDSPINFEVMNGQDVQVKTEFLEILETLAVNSTGIPIELLQMRRNQIDFAIQAISTNTKVLRHGISRQSKVQKMLSPFLTKIYNYEFNENEVLTLILPPAFHGNMDNVTMMVENTINMCNALSVIEYGDNPDTELDQEISIFKRLYARRVLGSLIDIDDIDNLKAKAKIMAKVDKKKEEE